MFSIAGLHQIELQTLKLFSRFRATQIAHLRLGHRHLVVPDGSTLEAGWQERGSIKLLSTVHQRRRDGDETRQVVVFATQSISNPSPHTWPRENG